MTMTMNDTASIFENIAKVGAVIPTTLNGLPGMSSLEIAEATGKSHKHVLRDIKKMLNEIGPLLDQCQYVETQAPDGYGRNQPLIVLDKELTFTVLTGYNTTLRLLLNRRWLELEGTGFKRMSVQETVVHLVECEKDNRQAALRKVNRGRQLSPAAQERKRMDRKFRRNAEKARKNGDRELF